ncbi:DUF6059 family protein [Actinomadura monticuli]|uniref:DUF6059 family protein n=1 Tax=Actinomadura monticuli TaxID=3097367 RepID=A0ABV4Q5M2_9ACTN
MGRGRLRRALRYLSTGMGYVGFGVIGMTPSQYMRYVAQREDGAAHEPGAAGHAAAAAEDPPDGSLPPPAHPERLVPGEPLSEEASRLWAQLGDLGR